MSAPRLIEPLGFLFGAAASDAVADGLALPLAGGPAAFSLARLVDERRTVPAAAIPPQHFAVRDRITAAPPDWAGLGRSRPAVMGILNVTPDSFSDGGRYAGESDAVSAGLAMWHAGADIIDVGGESTRPDSPPTDPHTESARAVPVVRALADAGARVSIDTRHASTMRAALAAGASIVNDVSGLAHDPEAAAVVAEAKSPVVIMHMRGTPATMNRLAEYRDIACEVARELAARADMAEAAGVARARIALDPGIGFAKIYMQNVALLSRLGLLLGLGFPLVVGVSRKIFIGRLGGAEQPAGRDPGSLAAGLFAAMHGAAILRVHDVPGTVQAVRVWRGLTGAEWAADETRRQSVSHPTESSDGSSPTSLRH